MTSRITGTKEEILSMMEENAREAEAEFFDVVENMKEEDVKEGMHIIMRWIEENFMGCGYKRLGRLIVKYIREEDGKE